MSLAYRNRKKSLTRAQRHALTRQTRALSPALLRRKLELCERRIRARDRCTQFRWTLEQLHNERKVLKRLLGNEQPTL